MHNTSGVLPYKVRFSEGDSDWFKAEDVNLVLDAGSLVKVASKGVGLIVGKKNAKGNSQFKVQLQNGSPEWCHEKCLSPVSCKCGAIPPAEGAAHEAYKMPRANASMLPVAKSQKTGAGSLKPDARHGAASVRLTGPGLQMPGTASHKFAASSGLPGRSNLPGLSSQVPGPRAVSARPRFASPQIPPSQRSAGSQMPLAASHGQSVKIFRASPYGGPPLQGRSLSSLASGNPAQGPPKQFRARTGY
mmetsp:Transcript_83081/g.146759  ORF Transcript_83081/g.146759 Transcript_83081/m.146759 type:complete len:246 (-) Transcript_83081:14-751(-)